MKIFLIALFCSLLPQALSAKDPAALVLYFKNHDTIYLLLADDIRASKGWSSFAGGADEDETPQQTAAREAEEESRGYFSRKWLHNKIKDQEPFKEHGLALFFLEIPFVPAQRIQKNPIQDKLNVAMYERVNYAWIPMSDIIKAFSDKEAKVNPLYLPKQTHSDFYLGHWLKAMKAAYEQNALPWQKPL